MQPNNVLIARFSAIGDVAMTLPHVYAACRSYPHTSFVMVTRPLTAQIFINAPANLTVVAADIDGEYAGIGGIVRLTRMLCAEYRPEVFIDLHNVLRTRIMAALLRTGGIATHRLVKDRRGRKALTRPDRKALAQLIPQHRRYSDVFSAAGFPSDETFNGLFGGHGTADTSLFAAITPPKPAGTRWIGIAPFATHAGKVYPVESMEKVLVMLQEYSVKNPLKIFLFGGGVSEREILDRWASKYPATTSLAGKRYGFKTELALMNHLDAILTMDSANMHLAALASTPTLSIWGATHPYCGFAPEGSRGTDFIQADMPCRPCSVFGNKPCRYGDMRCMASIAPETIFSRLTAIL